MTAKVNYSDRERIYLICAAALACLFVGELAVQPLIGGTPNVPFLLSDAALGLYAASHLIRGARLRAVMVAVAAVLAVAWLVQR